MAVNLNEPLELVATDYLSAISFILLNLYRKKLIKYYTPNLKSLSLFTELLSVIFSSI